MIEAKVSAEKVSVGHMMHLPAFCEGDVVQLASGGPRMTVKERAATGAGHGEVVCMWFAEDGHIRQGVFPLTCVRKAEGKK